MRTFVVALVIVGASATILSGCGSSDPTANEQTPPSTNKMPPPGAYGKMVNDNPNIDPKVKKILMGAGGANK
jgi:hypothetical protein